MNEFELIERCFKHLSVPSDELIKGIGDDAACLSVPSGQHVLVTTDTLVSGVHFLAHWDPYDIAWRSVMVNVSDIAAMGGTPRFASLALTLPLADSEWLSRFSRGIHDALARYAISLIGGDTTKGPLSITLTLHGLVDEGKAVYRSGAQVGDRIVVTGHLGAAALAVQELTHSTLNEKELQCVMEKLLHPKPRLDFRPILQDYAHAAIDLSDGLSSDLHHICTQSSVGAEIDLERLPMHPCLTHRSPEEALRLALSGGDDYELCFTVAPARYSSLQDALQRFKLEAFDIGRITEGRDVWGIAKSKSQRIIPDGYRHF